MVLAIVMFDTEVIARCLRVGGIRGTRRTCGLPGGTMERATWEPGLHTAIEKLC